MVLQVLNEGTVDLTFQLINLQKAKDEYTKRYPSGEKPSFTTAEIKGLLNSLKCQWTTGNIAIQDKKEILRCLVDKIFIQTAGKTLVVEIVWHGQSITRLEVPKYLFSSSHIYHRIKDLALSCTDSEIMEILNKDGILTMKSKTWTVRRVMDFRLSNQIPSGFTKSIGLKIEQGYVASSEAAKVLNASITEIQKLFKLGILEGKRGAEAQSRLWIYLDADIVRRLNGTAKFDATIQTFGSVMKNMSISKEELVKWIKLKGHEILRLKRGKVHHFYIRPIAASYCDGQPLVDSADKNLDAFNTHDCSSTEVAMQLTTEIGLRGKKFILNDAILDRGL